jgi:hypothetical protein
VAEFATRNTSTQAVIADTYLIILVQIGKVILAFRHGSYEDTNTLLWLKCFDVVLYAHNRSLKTQSDLSAVWWEMIGDGILDDAKEWFVRLVGANMVTLEELNHQTSETLECTGKADGGVDFNENILGCMDVYLQFASFVDRGI